MPLRCQHNDSLDGREGRAQVRPSAGGERRGRRRDGLRAVRGGDQAEHTQQVAAQRTRPQPQRGQVRRTLRRPHRRLLPQASDQELESEGRGRVCRPGWRRAHLQDQLQRQRVREAAAH